MAPSHTSSGGTSDDSTLGAARKSSTTEPPFDINLPYRTLSPQANLNEYTQEVAAGEIPAASEKNISKYRLVTFLPDDPENPKNWSKAYKWYCTMVVAFTCFVVALASAVITADIPGVEKSFGVSEEAALLSVTLFVMGFGIGKCLKLLS
jgi:hypothetical protein